MMLPLEVITGVAGLATGAAGTWVAVSTLLERRQPIVVAHEDQERTYDQNAQAWFALAHLRNESGPAAFNVRFGVEYGGTRFPYRMTVDDPDEGNYQRVLQPGARLPADDTQSLPILITSSDIWATAAAAGALDEGRVYWCRYENARGWTWETRNPGSRSAKLEIRRVWRVKRRELAERADRERVRSEGRAWIANALAALTQRSDASPS